MVSYFLKTCIQLAVSHYKLVVLRLYLGEPLTRWPYCCAHFMLMFITLVTRVFDFICMERLRMTSQTLILSSPLFAKRATRSNTWLDPQMAPFLIPTRLLVCPMSGKWNWQYEIDEWTTIAKSWRSYPASLSWSLPVKPTIGSNPWGSAVLK